jgi:hypothetical protein
MTRVYSVCDLCFDSLAALDMSCAGRWLLYCQNARETTPYLIYKCRLDYRLRSEDEKELLLLEERGFIITQETSHDSVWTIKLLGIDQCSGSVCVHYHKRHQIQKRREV